MAKKVKEYFLRFGYEGEKQEDAAALISEALDIQFFESENEFFGKQLLYDGKVADGIMIMKNYYEEDDLWMCEEHKECPIIITCAFRSGTKSSVNELQGTYVKTAFSNIEGFTFIDFEGREAKEFDSKEALRHAGMNVGDETVDKHLN